MDNNEPRPLAEQISAKQRIALVWQNIVEIGLLIAQFSSLPSLGDAPNLRAFF